MKNLKHLGLVLGSDADAVVFHRIDAPAVIDTAGHLDMAQSVRMAILDGVANEIGKNLIDLSGIAPAVRQRLNREHGPGFLELEFHRLRDFCQHGAHVEALDG